MRSTSNSRHLSSTRLHSSLGSILIFGLSQMFKYSRLRREQMGDGK